MSFNAAETANLDAILKRDHYYISPSERWGDLCDIKNEGDTSLLFVRRPVGYNGLIYVLGLLAIALVIGLGLSFVIKLCCMVLVIVGVLFALFYQPKREISFYTDAEYKRLAFRIVQRKGDKFLTRLCEVRGPQNELLAVIKKDFSIGPKTIWRIYRPSQELWARAIGDVPFSETVKALIYKYQHGSVTRYKAFQFFQKESNLALGEIDIRSDAGDHLNLQADPECKLDRRVALSVSVVLRSL